MEMPYHLQQQAAQNLSIECEAALNNSVAAARRKMWAVVLGLVPFKDGDWWCVLFGKNQQEGVAAFGETPEEAFENFDKKMRAKG